MKDGPPRPACGHRRIAGQGEDDRQASGTGLPADRDPGGHVSDLPAKALGRTETLVLATDPDREGEAIAWQVLAWHAERGAIGEKPVHRVAFHEVTPAAVRTPLMRPRDIDMDLVEAWRARRALDYLVG